MNINDLRLSILCTIIINAILLGASIAAISIASRQRRRQIIALTDARLLYEQELRGIESEVSEKTLSHLSSELHDNIGQVLAVARLQIEKIYLSNPDVIECISPLADSLDLAFKQVRLLSRTLDTNSIAETGLIKSLLVEVSRLQDLKVCNLIFDHGDESPGFTYDQSIVIFRIAQETLSNALRHAMAKNVRINLDYLKNDFLTIADDGMGFDLAIALKVRHGMGLQSMMKRARLAGFSLMIDSTLGKGTKIILRQITDTAINWV